MHVCIALVEILYWSVLPAVSSLRWHYLLEITYAALRQCPLQNGCLDPCLLPSASLGAWSMLDRHSNNAPSPSLSPCLCLFLVLVVCEVEVCEVEVCEVGVCEVGVCEGGVWLGGG